MSVSAGGGGGGAELPGCVYSYCFILNSQKNFTRYVGGPWNSEHDIIGKWFEMKNKVSHIFNQLYFQRLVCMTIAPYWLDMCDKLLVILAALSPSAPTLY